MGACVAFKNEAAPIAVVMGKHTAGGIKSVIMNYYRNINREILQFDLLVDDDSPLKDYAEIKSLGGRVYEIPSSKNPAKNVMATYNILKYNNYKCVHGYLNTLNILPMLAGKLAKVPVRIAENLSTAHPGEKKTIIKNILKPLAKLFPTHLAANSQYAAAWLYGTEKLPQCKIIYNALNLDEYTYDEALRLKMRKELGLEDKFVIGHIGRYEYQKNHNFLVDIFHSIYKKNANARLLLVGYGGLKEDIFRKINDLNLQNVVLDLGLTEDILPLYNAMDSFVLPSFYEGLPVVGIEAQATGLPCVMSTEVTSETKVTDLARFIDLKSPVEFWADEILKCQSYNRVNTRKELAEHGYDIKIEAKKLEEYYLNLLR